MNIASVTSSAVKSLRAKALLDEVPKTQIAEDLGVTRQTVARRLKANDMMLSDFISTAEAVGADPVDVLAEAIGAEQRVTA
ncbi:hypothetical protein [Bifidobacterium panos]|uniref:hypothetical protein n=1 Tax=Bifidobacterium panos TaxID=2675321 RepID=UPI00155720FD|nr:hypothetical protein [Bifidobacterium sp. DSM 109963]